MASSPLGRPTRGTTGTNRLRRNDRWIAASPAFRQAADPLVIDLGYGASGVTAFELATRLRAVRADVEVRGLEIDPARVALANAQLAEVRAGRTPFSPALPVSFARGGFEVPLTGGRRTAVIRAMNVLRQYDESDVSNAWQTMAARLTPDGVLIEGTCDEIGRRACWVLLDGSGPLTVTFACKVETIERPSDLAERLPKALIHHNVPGQAVHTLLRAFDAAWDAAAPMSAFGPRQRWVAACRGLAESGVPVDIGRARHGELSVAWGVVAPS